MKIKKNNTVITADEFFIKYADNTSLAEGHYDYLIEKDSFKEAMIEFAKLHVTEALNNIKKETQLWDDCPIIPYEKIVYPLENIK